MFKIGAGYNRLFAATLLENHLEIPQGVELIELGLEELRQWKKSAYYQDIPLSLHLARSPITEGYSIQKKFLNEIKTRLGDQVLTSVGFHLTGTRDSGIGALGFSSHYLPNKTSENRAISFLKAAQDTFNTPIWLENANFYSAGANEIFNNWLSVTKILKSTGTSLILDLSHMIIDSANVGLNDHSVIGLIPWEKVSEFHVSGITQSKDGALHDGHNQRVDQRVWKLLEEIMHLVPHTEKPIYVTVEHTDPDFVSKKHEYYNDFTQVLALIGAPKRIPRNQKSHAQNYARSYLCRILKKRYPLLEASLSKRNLLLSSLTSEWVDDTHSKGFRIVLSESERYPFEKSKVRSIDQDFLPYLKERLSC